MIAALLDLATLALFTDAVRWWGTLAGTICLADYARRVRRRLAGEAHPVNSMWWEAHAKALLGMFLVLAGGMIPLATRVDGFGIESPSFLLGMAIAWVCVASAGWCYAISRAEHRWTMAVVAAFALATTWLASYATVHP